MKTVKPSIDKSRFHRTAFYRPPYGGNVHVFQSVDIGTWRWEKTRINWSAIGSVNPKIAAHFAAVIQDACALALLWDKELAGKKIVKTKESES